MNHQSPRFVVALCLVPWLAAINASCSANADSEGSDTTPGVSEPDGTTTVDPGAVGEATTNPLGRTRCTAPAGMSGSPATIEEAVALLNALPKPTSVACFVESLDRPLAAFASSSTFSAQPAASSVSPRVFIKVGQLWISIVIDGDSSYLIEFGYQLDDGLSIKAELEGPFPDQVIPSAPYDHVLLENRSVCGICHRDEEPAETVTFATAFKSRALRPASDSYVSVSQLATEAHLCDWSAEPHRCEMLSALFDGGTVVEESFPSSMPTFP